MIEDINAIKKAARSLCVHAINNGFQFEAIHRYRNKNGEIIYYRNRLKHPDGNKKIFPMHQNQTGNFCLGEPPEFKDKPKPLYRLDLLAKNPEAAVIIVEGEKATNALNQFFSKQGLNAQYVAITSGSASSAKMADWTPITNRNCIIWPDNDDPGIKYAYEVFEHLNNLKCKSEILDLRNFDLPVGADCVEWIEKNPDASINDFLKIPTLLIDLKGEKNSKVVTPLTDHETIKNLANLSILEYGRIRKDTAATLGIKVSSLDQLVKEKRNQMQEDQEEQLFIDPDPEPWNEPINLSILLTEITNAIQRFIFCSIETAHAATLWVAMTWVIDIVRVAPLAVITAPEKRCGKSQLLAIFGKLVKKPIPVSNITSAALFRTIDATQPTLLIDEADTFMLNNDELRGVINSGHTRDSAYTIRLVGPEHTPKRFNVWGAKAIAGIGNLADTIMDRAIRLELHRKFVHENIEKIRDAEPDLFITLKSKLVRFAQDYFEPISNSKPMLPKELNDRAQDNWEPLLAIADLAGTEWGIFARSAALKLSNNIQEESISMELLTDIYEIIKNKDRITTENLLSALRSDQEKRWFTYERGSPMNARQLSKQLKLFGIRSKSVRFNYDIKKGYTTDQFADVFNRYISVLPVTTSQANDYNDFDVTEPLLVTDK
ncbi:MAG: DUF3631 domain-containing protein [Gammaproteobacteria bacterium]